MTELETSDVVASGGELGTLVRAFDWARTSLGPRCRWSPALRAAVDLLWRGSAPMMLWWGPELVQLYNDAFRPLLGARHPDALGVPARTFWGDRWAELGPAVDASLAGVSTASTEDLLVLVRRQDAFQEAHFHVGYVAIPASVDDPTLPASAIGGVLAVMTEITAQVQGWRELTIFSQLGARLGEDTSADQLGASAMAALAVDPFDIPFALLYLAEPGATHARLVGSCGFAATDRDGPATPQVIAVHDSAALAPWPVARVLATGQAERLEHPFAGVGTLPTGAWSTSPRHVLVLPLASAASRVHGALVVGTSPYRPLDHDYQAFLDRISATIGDAVAKCDADPTSAHASAAPLPAGLDAADVAGDPVQLEQVMRGEIDGYTLDRRWIRADGRIVCSTISVRGQRAPDGTVDRVVVCIEDTGARRQVGDTVPTASARLDVATRGAATGIWEIDLFPACDARGPSSCSWRTLIADASTAMALVHPDDRERVEHALEAHLRGETPECQLEHRLRGVGGSYRWVLSRGTVTCDDAGHRLRLVGATIDITDRKLAELRLREREQSLTATVRKLEGVAAEASAAVRAKDEFLAMLGHELRGPLMPIVTSLASMRRAGQPGREQEILERQVSHLIRLVDDLLDVSRATRGRLELRKRPVELAEVVQSAVETVFPLLEQDHHGLDITVPHHGFVVEVDPERMAQVVANLLTNASKYSEPGSAIEVHAARTNASIELRVKDHGIGIAPDMIGRVFDLFVQDPDSIERSRGGLGLGLTIAQSIVRLHGGSVRARSEGPGRGSEFVVELPAFDLRSDPVEPAAASATAADAATASAHKRVLVVDDNLDAADALASALEELGYEAEVAHDGPSALEAAQARTPDIALVDIGLPGMDGYELARRMLEQAGKAHALHLVAVTGYGRESDRQRSSDAGFEHHLIKPIDLVRLERVMTELQQL